MFSGAFPTAIIGAEIRIRAALEVIRFMLVGTTVRVAGGVILSASALAEGRLRLWRWLWVLQLHSPEAAQTAVDTEVDHSRLTRQ